MLISSELPIPAIPTIGSQCSSFGAMSILQLCLLTCQAAANKRVPCGCRDRGGSDPSKTRHICIYDELIDALSTHDDQEHTLINILPLLRGHLRTWITFFDLSVKSSGSHTAILQLYSGASLLCPPCVLYFYFHDYISLFLAISPANTASIQLNSTLDSGEDGKCPS